MAKGFKHGSGGVPLNFQVAGGTTQPTNPKENTIWVNTDTAVNGWIFSATEPSPGEPGMVWIQTGTPSNVEFNALKKNSIQVYPISAKQYVSGAWVDVTAQSYQSGAWADWANPNLLFDYGDENIALTGGYVKSNDNIVTTSDADGTLTFDFPNTTHSFWYTKNPVDLTGKTTLNIIGSVPNNGYSQIGFWKNLPTGGVNVDAGLINTHAYGTHTVDISDLDGTYYFGVRSYGIDGHKLSKAWLG